MAGRGDLESLVELARAGSSAAWGRVYETLAPSVFRICRRVLRSREDAEDATSEIFLKARVRLASYESSRPFTPWLNRVAANHCWDEIRKRRTRAELDDGELELSALEDEAPTPQEAVLAIESRQSLRRVLSELDDRSRLAIVLRYYADMSYEDIGQSLGISPNFVGVLLLRARRTLRTGLTRGGTVPRGPAAFAELRRASPEPEGRRREGKILPERGASTENDETS